MKAKWVIALLVGVAVPEACAATLFKCVDARGASTYQQTPCPESAKQAESIAYQRVPDTPQVIEEEVTALQVDEYQADIGYANNPQGAPQAQSGRSSAVYQDRFGATINSRSAEAEELRQAQNRASSRERRATNRALYGTSRPEAGNVVPGQGFARGAPPPPRVAPPTQQVRTDQYGNRYQQPPGSNIVIDEKTGKQCFLVGNVVQCN
jgi:hypothetical protein